MPMAVVVVLAPSFLIRIVIRAWPKGDPRRRELLAELAALPVPNRLLWVLGVFELAWQEGLPQRREQSVLWPDVARLPGAVKLGVVAVDVVGVAVVNVPMARVGFAVSALGLLPLTVKHVRATYAFADTTALMGIGFNHDGSANRRSVGVLDRRARVEQRRLGLVRQGPYAPLHSDTPIPSATLTRQLMPDRREFLRMGLRGFGGLSLQHEGGEVGCAQRMAYRP